MTKLGNFSSLLAISLGQTETCLPPCHCSISPVIRPLPYLIEWVNWLEQEGAGLKSLQEAIDTTSTGGKLTFHIFAALAEFERQLIQERTQAGLNAARARGRLGGRPKALSASKQKRAVGLYQEKQLAVQEICKIMGISKPTLYAYVRQAQSAT